MRGGAAGRGPPPRLVTSPSSRRVSAGLLTKFVLGGAVAVVIFMLGIGVGVQFFDAHVGGGGGAPARPWLSWPGSQTASSRAGRAGRVLRRAGDAEAARVGGAAVADGEPAARGGAGAGAERGEAPPGEGGGEAADDEVVAADEEVAAEDEAAAAAAPAPAAAGGEEEDEDAGGASLLGALPGAPLTPPSLWLDVAGGAAQAVSLAARLDARAVSGGAWIYLDGREKSASIKTVLASRAAGCAVDDAHRGWSLAVNNWEAGDRALVLEWRDSAAGAGAGCGRLSSEPGAVPYDAWVHVGFSLAPPRKGAPAGAPGTARLFLNGELLKSAPARRRDVDVAAGAASPPSSIGASADGRYAFVGRIAHAFVVTGAITPRQLAATVRVTDGAGWAAFARAADARLLGLFLLRDTLAPAVGPAELGLTDTPANAAWVAARTFTRARLMPARAGTVLLELTGRAEPAGAAWTRAGSPPGGEAAAGGGAPGAKGAAGAGAGEGEGGAADGVSVRKSAADRRRAARAAAAAAAEEEEERELDAEEEAGTGKDEAGSAAADADAPLRGGRVHPPVAPARRYAEGAASSKVPAALARGRVPGVVAPGAFDFTGGGNQWLPVTMRAPADAASGSPTDPVALAAGTFSDDVTQEALAASDELGRARALEVKAAMQHVWSNYKAHAWGFDELKPQRGVGENNWQGLGMSLVDSLDTLWVMGMRAEFDEARAWVAASLDFDKAGGTSVFEITIRVLGGLLAAYDLSGARVFLDKAKELGDRLLPAFNTPSGLPRATISLANGQAGNPGWTGGASVLAELGTLQVEFRYLSRATGDPVYAAKAEAVIARMDAIHPADGLFPIYISADTGLPASSVVTFGALGDSFYEYLVKVWVQGGRAEPLYRRMYDAAMDGMTAKMLKRSRPSNLAYVAEWNGGGTEDKMDHLVCFVPGMLALGAYTAGGTGGEAAAARDLANAKALAYTCWQMYERTATGIGAEFSEFPGGADLVPAARAPFYILRPEAAESLFILHQLTGNPVYREWGYKMFKAIERGCRTPFGYGAHPDVRDAGRAPDDRMESFFMAETLKYLYLLQSPDHDISLDRYTFNTEAHPLSVWGSERWAQLRKGAR